MSLGTPDRAKAVAFARGDIDPVPLFEEAQRLRDERTGRTITYSRKVFIPLTTLCMDTCSYCTFAKPPGAGGEYLEPEDVLAIARAGERFGCTEALLTLGDRPEDRWPQAREFLERHGCGSTIEYVQRMSELIVAETSLFPHANPGLMNDQTLRSLRSSNVSAGMMLENISPRLMEPGMPHHNCPDKEPTARVATIEAAGRQKVPFTTGVLVGIGETTEELVDSLFAIKELQVGQIQEVIVQNFRAKADTRMRREPEPTPDYVRRVVAVARWILGPEVNLQVPPNLSDHYEILLDSGINDWGGVSPITIDWVNPEQPWPHLDRLREKTEASGFELVARLPAYPEFLTPEWLSPPMLERALRSSDDNGYALISIPA